MTTVRRHPLSIALAVTLGLALGLVAATAGWSTGAVYLAALLLVLALAAGAIVTEQRGRRGREGSPHREAHPAPRGR